MKRFKWPGAVVVILVISFGLAEAVQADSPAIVGVDMVAAAKSSIKNVSTNELKLLIEKNSNLVLIDVRMPNEIALNGGSINSHRTDLKINRGWLEFRIAEAVPALDTPIVVYCGINQRSPLAAVTLENMGYSNVVNYADGAMAWRDAGLPMSVPDKAPGTMLYSKPILVAPNVYSSIGATAPPSYENSGHNNNLSFIVTTDGVMVVNAGDNALLAQALHNEIKQVTDEPVRYVVLENGQGHAMLGSSYWQAQGATVIAHADAAAEIESRGENILTRMQSRARDKSMGTYMSKPDKVFEETYVLELGDTRIELLNLGPAHSPGDIVVWLPDSKLVISGDMAFHQRLLPVFEDTGTADWVDSWGAFAALEAEIVIPGHGAPTNMKEVTTYTVGYLKYMREKIGEILDNGGSLIDAYKIDQSAYQHLDTFEELSGLNADRIYREMEFE